MSHSSKYLQRVDDNYKGSSVAVSHATNLKSPLTKESVAVCQSHYSHGIHFQAEETFHSGIFWMTPPFVGQRC